MLAASRIRFGNFELDIETTELWKKGRRLKFPPKPLRVLALLVTSPGELVTRETIRSQIWGDEVFVNFEQGLNFSIRKLRSVLGDSARKPKFIETLPRRGYRFIAAIEGCDLHPVPHAPVSEAAQIQASELYARARRSFASVDKGGLETARADFESALTLHPDYALAHSGLGATYALRNLNRRDPADLEQARLHLERALELDAELAEPYPWLCYVYMRLDRSERAFQYGHRGIQLRPDLAQAHYFLGLAYFASCERDPANYSKAASHLLEAGRVGPEWQPTWFVLSYLALMMGDYDRALEFAGRLLNSRPPGLPFIGAEIVIASVEIRRSRLDAARKTLMSFLERMSTSDHMYRDSMVVIAACLLGDVEMRQGRPAEALQVYRKAWEDVQEHPRTASHKRIAARVQAGLASAYAALGDQERAVGLLETALRLGEESRHPEHAAAGAHVAELFLSQCTACLRAGRQEQALSLLQRSVECGWMDAPALQLDPELAPLRNEPGFVALVEELQTRPKPTWVAASVA